MHICIHICSCTYICIYIQRYRERERAREYVLSDAALHLIVKLMEEIFGLGVSCSEAFFERPELRQHIQLQLLLSYIQTYIHIYT